MFEPDQCLCSHSIWLGLSYPFWLPFLECRGPKTKSSPRQPLIRAYTDVLTITTASVAGTRRILQGLEKLITWGRMSFRASKSRSLVLKNGRVHEKYRFTLSGDTIPFINKRLMESLGKIFDASHKDSSSIKKTTKDLKERLMKALSTCHPAQDFVATAGIRSLNVIS